MGHFTNKVSEKITVNTVITTISRRNLELILNGHILITVIISTCCDESVSRGRKTGTKGRETGTKGRRTGTIGTKERGNEKPYGLVQIEYLDRGTSPRHVWTWRGRVTPFLDV